MVDKLSISLICEIVPNFQGNGPLSISISECFLFRQQYPGRKAVRCSRFPETPRRQAFSPALCYHAQ